MNELSISHYVDETKVLGPYNRSALWVRGCCFDCLGCIAKEMNREAPNIVNLYQLADHFSSLEGTEGITISGGEPFLQSEALYDMVAEIRKKRDYGVIVYSGFTLEELQSKAENDESVKKFLNQIDILIDGRYDQSKDDGRPYRGSENQRIITLTDRYKDIYNEYYVECNKRNLEIKVTPNNIYMVGVPSKHGLETWKELKKKAELK